MSRWNDLTYYRSLLCLEESHFRFYLAVRDGTTPPSPGSKPGVLTFILTDIYTAGETRTRMLYCLEDSWGSNSSTAAQMLVSAWWDSNPHEVTLKAV